VHGVEEIAAFVTSVFGDRGGTKSNSRPTGPTRKAFTGPLHLCSGIVFNSFVLALNKIQIL
jgi:hypothetical protein